MDSLLSTCTARWLARHPGLAALTATCIFSLGCDTLDWLGPEDERLIQTEELEYQLTPDWVGLSVEIPYTFTNSTGRRVYLPNCNGSFGIRLIREQDGEWITAWAPIRPACASPPIVIEPGATFANTLRAWGAPPDSTNWGPNFDLDDPSGTYRIEWSRPHFSYDANAPSSGTVLPFKARVSNRFSLRM